MKKIILLIFLVLSAISCELAKFQSFTNTKYPPTKNVDLYTDKKPEREYIEIGRIIVEEDAFTGEKNMVKGAIEKAQKVGADGLIWAKEDKDMWAIPAYGSILAGE